jgi:hypothetical protein
MIYNPFVPFHLATGKSFINRETEIMTVMARIAKGASSSIVGNPHIGKSSLLRQVNDSAIIEKFLPNPKNYIFIEVDFQSFVTSDEPDDFWEFVLEEALRIDSRTREYFEALLEKKTFDSRRLLGAFSRLATSGHRVVLLIDEFDYLLSLKNFRTLDFVSPLRVLAMKSDGLVVVTANRLSVAQLNAEAADLKDRTRGSDLFNYLEEVSLGSLPAKDVTRWLDDYFKNRAVIAEIRHLAGLHPLLIQLAGEIYFDAVISDRSLRQQFQTQFVLKAEAQFQDVWNYLEPKAQIALVIFALNHLQGRMVSGEEFSLEDAEKYLAWYGSEIGDMLRRGTLEESIDGSPSIGSHAFITWIVERKIVGTRGDEPREDFMKWLAKKEYKLGGNLTQEEIDCLQTIWKSIPKSLIQGIRKLLLPESSE